MWYLESLEKEETVLSYSHFREERIKEDLFKYFEENPNDELWFYKESFNNSTVGDDFISVFVLHNGNVCREVYRGNKTYYKRIHKSV